MGASRLFQAMLGFETQLALNKCGDYHNNFKNDHDCHQLGLDTTLKHVASITCGKGVIRARDGCLKVISSHVGVRYTVDPQQLLWLLQ